MTMNTPVYRFVPANDGAEALIEFTGETTSRLPLPAQASIRVEKGQLRLSLDTEARTCSPVLKWVQGLGEIEFTRIDFGAFVVDVQTGTERVQIDHSGLERALGLTPVPNA